MSLDLDAIEARANDPFGTAKAGIGQVDADRDALLAMVREQQAAIDAAKDEAHKVKRFRGELKSLGKHLDSWESQGHTTATIRFLRGWIADRAAELRKS
jgi:hypothetical protein